MAQPNIKDIYYGVWDLGHLGVGLPGVLKRYDSGALVLEVTASRDAVFSVGEGGIIDLGGGDCADCSVALFEIELSDYRSYFENFDKFLATLKIKHVIIAKGPKIDGNSLYKYVKLRSDLYNAWIDERKAEIGSIPGGASIPDSKSYCINAPQLDARIALLSGHTVSYEDFFSASIRKDSEIILEFESGREFPEIYKLSERISQLIYLLSGVKSYPKIVLFSDDLGIREVEVYSWESKSFNLSPVTPFSILIGFALVEKEFGEALTELIESYDKYRNVLEIIEDLLWGHKKTVRAAFMLLVQAVESVHDALNLEKLEINKKQYREHRKKIEEFVNSLSLNDNITFNINDAIAHAYKKTLSVKLGEIITAELYECFGILVTREEFLNRIKKTRNYYTHLDQKDRPGILEGEELLKATRLVAHAIEYQILVHIGIPKAIVLDSLSSRSKISSRL